MIGTLLFSRTIFTDEHHFEWIWSVNNTLASVSNDFSVYVKLFSLCLPQTLFQALNRKPNKKTSEFETREPHVLKMPTDFQVFELQSSSYKLTFKISNFFCLKKAEFLLFPP